MYNEPSSTQQQTRNNTTQPATENNNNNTIWRGSVFTGEEPPPHSGELNRALLRADGPTQSQLSRPMSSGHHISMEHRLRRKQSNSDTNASNQTYFKEVHEKRKEETFFLRKKEKRKRKKRPKKIGFPATQKRKRKRKDKRKNEEK